VRLQGLRYGLRSCHWDYGTTVRVERGHLVLEDGIGPDRRHARFPRVGHGLKRLVVIGSDGLISFAALRWLSADQNAAFVMLERDGKVLATIGPVHPSDARLRRAQALAGRNGNAVQLAIELITKKLAGQEKVARERLNNLVVAESIAKLRSGLQSVRRLEAVLSIEANAALAYWSAWSKLEIQYPRIDLRRVPDHWTFGARVSPLTGSPRLAVNPPNAILNYLYAILESEARLAAAELGLDPGLGVLHKDTPNRDSLACDLMEPVRPLVDAYVFDWMKSGPLRKEWFFEQAYGNCRLMGPFAAQLSETAAAWRKAVSPYAEQAVKIFWQGRSRRSKFTFLPTRLTQSRRSLAKSGNLVLNVATVPKSNPRCPVCGARVTSGSLYCAKCVPLVNRDNLLLQAKLGRIATHSATAEARRSATQARQAEALRKWHPSDLPTWLDEDCYRREILPRLAKFTVKKIRLAIEVSHPYATLIRREVSIPHPRHWLPLAELTGHRR
jgi:CRISPR-associated endonuclease Cas1